MLFFFFKPQCSTSNNLVNKITKTSFVAENNEIDDFSPYFLMSFSPLFSSLNLSTLNLPWKAKWCHKHWSLLTFNSESSVQVPNHSTFFASKSHVFFSILVILHGRPSPKKHSKNHFNPNQWKSRQVYYYYKKPDTLFNRYKIIDQALKRIEHELLCRHVKFLNKQRRGWKKRLLIHYSVKQVTVKKEW